MVLVSDEELEENVFPNFRENFGVLVKGSVIGIIFSYDKMSNMQNTKKKVVVELLGSTACKGRKTKKVCFSILT